MRRALVTSLFVLPVLALAAGCGGDDEPSRAATAEAGSEFCDRAAEAETLGDAVNEAGTDPSAVEPAVRAALDAADATLEVAPDDVLERMTRTVAYQHEVADLLEQNDWDPSRTTASSPSTARPRRATASTSTCPRVRRASTGSSTCS
jgi:hypothetical protein